MADSVTRSSLLVAALVIGGCGGDRTRGLDPVVFAMTSQITPFYDDGELKLYETQSPVNLPITKPSDADRAALGGAVGPFSHHPWVTADQVSVQVTWTLANLDKEDHVVDVLVDPWNEFGRYVPGITIQGNNAVPNLSGIDESYDLPGLGSGRPSRIQHTFSFGDMNELAIDLATAINVITKVTPPPAMAGQTLVDPRAGLVNHAFNVQNRAGRSPYTDSYVPPAIPALVGFNLGIRTGEPANVALEYSVEIVDHDGSKVVAEGASDPTLVAPRRSYTVPGAGAAAGG
jgi:hypothetical protein